MMCLDIGRGHPGSSRSLGEPNVNPLLIYHLYLFGFSSTLLHPLFSPHSPRSASHPKSTFRMATHVRLGSLESTKTRKQGSRPSTAPSAAPSSSRSPITTVHKHGVLHHAFPRTLAPYPVSHDNRVIDAYVVSIFGIFFF